MYSLPGNGYFLPLDNLAFQTTCHNTMTFQNIDLSSWEALYNNHHAWKLVLVATGALTVAVLDHIPSPLTSLYID
jgi:hypothetical protein